MISAKLKDQTRQLHEQTEREVDLPGRLKTVESYRQLLARFYGFYQPIENRLVDLASQHALGVSLAERQKVERLRSDLLALSWTTQDIDQLPQCNKLPPLETAADALGCLYVLEGSTLGGQYIARAAEKQLGLTMVSGISFFSGNGSSTGRMWNEFAAALNAYAEAHPESSPAIVASATRTFECFKDWIAIRDPS
jgi:heme oxygenase